MQSLWPKTLKAKTVAVVSVGVLVLIALIMLVNFYYGREVLREQLMGHVYSSVENIATELDEKLALRKQAIQDAAADIKMSKADLNYFAAQLLKQNASLSALFNRILIYSDDGRVLADYPQGRLTGLEVSSTDYFRQAATQFTVIVSAPYVSKVDPHPLINITAPLFDENRMFIGVLGGTIDLSADNFLGEISHRNIGESGYVTVMTQDGTTIAHPDSEWLLRSVPSAKDMPLLHQALQGWEGVEIGRDARGLQSLLAYKSLNEANWVVSGILPLREADQPLLSLGRYSVLMGVGFLLIFAPLLRYALSLALQPLDVMQLQMQEIQNGSREGLLTVQGSSELRDAAQVVNELLQQRLLMETALREKEAFYRALNEGAPLGIMMVNQQLEITYSNPELERMLGYSSEQMRTDWMDAVVVQDRDAIVQGWRDALVSSTQFEQSVRLRHAEGRMIWAQINARRILDDGKLLGYMVVVRDITDHKQAIDLLHTERRKALAVLDSISDAVVLTDADDYIQYINPPAEFMLALDGTEAIGTLLFSQCRIQTAEGAQPLDVDALHQHLASHGDDLVLVNSKGNHLPVDVLMTQVRDEESLGGHRVYVFYDASERRERERRMTWEATHDALTGLFNRRAFEGRLIDILYESKQSVIPTAVAIIDLDHFKAVNDAGGHLVGDEMLKQVARLLSAKVRNTDVVARIGGDEFGILLPGCDAKRAAGILEAIREAVATYQLVVGVQRYRVSTSIGFTCISVDDPDIKVVLQRADEGAYRSKAQGRDAVNLVARDGV